MDGIKMYLKDLKYEHRLIAEFVILLLVIIGSLAYVGNQRATALSEQIDILSSKIATLDSSLTQATEYLEQNIADTQNEFSSALQTERQNVSAVRDQLGTVKSEVGSISGTVSTLQKLSKTDPELLQKYSKVFFLNENYAPPRLTEIPEDNIYQSNKNFQIHSSVWPNLEKLLAEANGDGKDLFVFSAYRSFDTQQALKGRYTLIYGAGTANQFSADQGYSEHQLGTTIDFITLGIKGTLSGFDGTDAYVWLQANAYKYGFVLSYPKGNNFYVFEPWHWRFVGIKLATDLYNTDRNFYDLDQREIDEYLADIFD